MKDIREVAARYLEHKMRSVHEMKKRLREKDFDEEEIDELIEEFISLKYLDDYEYALHYIEYALGKKRGIQRIKIELRERGISEEDIFNAISDYEEEHGITELQDALSVGRELISGKLEIDERLTGRIVRKLRQRGYRDNDIIKVVSILKDELEAGSED